MSALGRQSQMLLSTLGVNFDCFDWATLDFLHNEEFRGEQMVPSLSKILIENSHQNMTIRAIFKDKDVMFTETNKRINSGLGPVLTFMSVYMTASTLSCPQS